MGCTIGGDLEGKEPRVEGLETTSGDLRVGLEANSGLRVFVSRNAGGSEAGDAGAVDDRAAAGVDTVTVAVAESHDVRLAADGIPSWAS